MQSAEDVVTPETALSPELPVVRALQVHSALGKGRSRPLVIEGEDRHLYVVKLRAAPKTNRRLIAEVVAGYIAAVLGVPQPHRALVQIDADLPADDLDGEKLEELRASTGSVFGSRLLDNVYPLRRGVDNPLSPADAARIVWFDSLVLNGDRKWRNPNILMRESRYWVIDNDSAFHAHHRWAEPVRWNNYAYSPIDGLVWWNSIDHVLLPWASSIAAIGEQLAPLVDSSVIDQAVRQVPETWFDQGFPDGSVVEPDLMYRAFLSNRLAVRNDWERLADVARIHGTCPERA